MATNVTEKDKTLNEIIDWANGKLDEYAKRPLGFRDYDYINGLDDAYQEMINHCRSMLGYSGQMPSEVPNQSEDAKE